MKHLEDAQLILYFDWVYWNEKIDPRLATIFHVQNEGKCSLAAGKKNKRKGKRAGVFDIIVPIPTKLSPGLIIEMKSGAGKLSPEQKAWKALMQRMGWDVRVCYSGEDAIAVTKGHMKHARPLSEISPIEDQHQLGDKYPYQSER